MVFLFWLVEFKKNIQSSTACISGFLVNTKIICTWISIWWWKSKCIVEIYKIIYGICWKTEEQKKNKLYHYACEMYFLCWLFGLGNEQLPLDVFYFLIKASQSAFERWNWKISYASYTDYNFSATFFFLFVLYNAFVLMWDVDVS